MCFSRMHPTHLDSVACHSGPYTNSAMLPAWPLTLALLFWVFCALVGADCSLQFPARSEKSRLVPVATEERLLVLWQAG